MIKHLEGIVFFFEAQDRTGIVPVEIHFHPLERGGWEYAVYRRKARIKSAATWDIPDHILAENLSHRALLDPQTFPDETIPSDKL